MSKSTLVAVKCRLSKGVFSSERIFEVKLANGEVYAGLAPTHFCWNAKGELLSKGEGEDQEIDGYVAARRLDVDLPSGVAAVELPDAQGLAVREEVVTNRPSPIVPPSARATA